MCYSIYEVLYLAGLTALACLSLFSHLYANLQRKALKDLEKFELLIPMIEKLRRELEVAEHEAKEK